MFLHPTYSTHRGPENKKMGPGVIPEKMFSNSRKKTNTGTGFTHLWCGPEEGLDRWDSIQSNENISFKSLPLLNLMSVVSGKKAGVTPSRRPKQPKKPPLSKKFSTRGTF